MARISDRERRRIFGQPCTSANLVLVTTPWGIRTRCHKLVAARFIYACNLAKTASGWTPRRIDSYACRNVRGSTSSSLHGFALAWDFFDRPLPQPVDVWGPANAPDAAFRDAFKTAGFFAGADFRRRADVPHLEWADGRPPPASPVESRPATVDEPPIKPVITSRLGEAEGMRISTWFTSIPALDNDGRGWIDVPYPLERVVSVVAQGSSPPDDGGYWHPVILTAQPRGEVTRVTLAGAAHQATGVWAKILEEEGARGGGLGPGRAE